MINCIVAFVLGLMYGLYGGTKHRELRDPRLINSQKVAALQILKERLETTNDEEKEEN